MIEPLIATLKWLSLLLKPLACGYLEPSRERLPLITLWKSLVLPIVEYCSLKKCHIQGIEAIQWSYSRKIHCTRSDYWDALKQLSLYSLERWREQNDTRSISGRSLKAIVQTSAMCSDISHESQTWQKMCIATQ